ncbi:hypothetical protein [Kitasatospora sp. NA04385]|uniref:hypothetical protein n=1 Tax=Kitasatospora sp. NA04385 TaxID=2742135 RepID=UPI001C37DB54|nr:hypothetical protein [Kitasatospora sp. NA04385]
MTGSFVNGSTVSLSPGTFSTILGGECTAPAVAVGASILYDGSAGGINGMVVVSVIGNPNSFGYSISNTTSSSHNVTVQTRCIAPS